MGAADAVGLTGGGGGLKPGAKDPRELEGPGAGEVEGASGEVAGAWEGVPAGGASSVPFLVSPETTEFPS